MTKKNTKTAETPTRKVRDKGAAATKAAMTPAVKTVASKDATIIPINAGGPALAAQAVPAAVALVEVSRQWADAKRMEAQGKSEAEAKRKEIIELHGGDPEKAIGFSNNFVDIRQDSSVDWSDPVLTTFLKEQGWFETLCKPRELDSDLVKSKALTEPELQKIIDSITKKKPKFFQVKDAKEDKQA